MFVLGYFLYDSVEILRAALWNRMTSVHVFCSASYILMGYLLRDKTKEFVSHLRDVSSDC